MSRHHRRQPLLLLHGKVLCPGVRWPPPGRLLGSELIGPTCGQRPPVPVRIGTGRSLHLQEARARQGLCAQPEHGGRPAMCAAEKKAQLVLVCCRKTGTGNCFAQPMERNAHPCWQQGGRQGRQAVITT
eukprot:1159567-Pelagomonas_calceolata.AAC.7